MTTLAKRHSHWAVFALLLGTVVLFEGCGAAETSDPVAVEQQQLSIKPLIEGIAQSGTVGSTAMELEQAAASQPELKADIDALIAADGNPAKVKEKANEILGKL